MNLYEKFDRYCTKLPGRGYIDSKLATTHFSALNRFIGPYLKKNNVKIILSTQLIDEQLYYIVEDVIERR